MASENETVEEVVCDMRAYDSGEIADVWMRRFADRIESAWRRERKQLIDENQLYKQELTHERTKTNLARSEVAELRESLKEAIASEYGRCHSRWPCALCGKDCKIKRWRKALEGAKSDATIRAIEARINDLGFSCNNMKQWMESMRRKSIQNYRHYKSAKADYIRLCKSIKELKDDLRRFKDGK